MNGLPDRSGDVYQDRYKGWQAAAERRAAAAAAANGAGCGNFD
jgi:hypothetical protein